jgi:8-oxo-dGTP diphosphatase
MSSKRSASSELDGLLAELNERRRAKICQCVPKSQQPLALPEQIDDHASAPEVQPEVPVAEAPLLRTLLSRPRVGVGCLVRCPDLHPGWILIGERKGSHGEGRWALPGGHLEGGQSFGECASMEFQEECGVGLPPSAWSTVLVTNDPMPADAVHYITVFVETSISAELSASIINGEPHKCVSWEWLPWASVRNKPLFIPLQHFLEQCGDALV